MDPVTALTAGKEAIGLVGALAKLVQDCKPKPGMNDPQSHTLGELLTRLQIEGVRMSRDLENRLRVVLGQMGEYGLVAAKTIDQQLQDLSWYKVLTRSRLKGLREELNAIHRQLTGFIDDATSLLLCQGKETLASVAFEESLHIRRTLDKMFLDSKTTLGDLLEGLLATASRVSADLQGA